MISINPEIQSLDKEANYKINKIFPFLEENLIIKIGIINKGDEIKIVVDQEVDCSLHFYESFLTLQQFTKLGKSFRQFDTIDEIMNGLINIFNNKNSNYFSYFSFYLSDKTEKILF